MHMRRRASFRPYRRRMGGLPALATEPAALREDRATRLRREKDGPACLRVDLGIMSKAQLQRASSQLLSKFVHCDPSAINPEASQELASHLSFGQVQECDHRIEVRTIGSGIESLR